jgi:sulfonate transport system substrate-binding protein
VKDLKGKKVGVTIGSVGHQLLYIYLRSVGLKPADIQQVNLAPGDILTALTGKNIDAAVTWEPYLTIAQAQKSANLIADGTGYKLNVNVIIASSDFLKSHHDVAVRLLKVFDKAEKWIKANPEKALELISRDSGFKVEALKPAFNKIALDLRLTPDAVKSIAETAAFVRENKIIRSDVNVNDLIDVSYLKAAGLQ